MNQFGGASIRMDHPAAFSAIGHTPGGQPSQQVGKTRGRRPDMAMAWRVGVLAQAGDINQAEGAHGNLR
ncbi:hypothetical protein PQR34_47940 [Paraburkholderia sediminicola]|uniref:hypothetical protein n=1 Tax=Paraburkholderia sediminicola TaxID=458836 RepID=UPI0038B77599